MSKKLWITVETVEDHGLLVYDKVYSEKKYVFINPRGFYEWLCQQMGINAKPDSLTLDGRVVVDANKLERLLTAEDAFRDVYRAWLDTEDRGTQVDKLMLEAESSGLFR